MNSRPQAHHVAKLDRCRCRARAVARPHQPLAEENRAKGDKTGKSCGKACRPFALAKPAGALTRRPVARDPTPTPLLKLARARALPRPFLALYFGLSTALSLLACDD